jgi:hypothetical protein
LSGFVKERTSEGVLRPVADAVVEHFYSDFYDLGRGDPTGFTVTNGEGYYVLCRYLDEFDQLAVVRKPGYVTSAQYVVTSRVDFELTTK